MSERSTPVLAEIDGGIEGVLLRPLTVDDAQRYFDLIDHDREHFRRVREPTADKYPTVESVRRSLEAAEQNGTGRVRLGIWSGHVMVGSINYEPIDTNTVEMGYWVGGAYTGHGYAARAVRTLIPHIFEQGWRWIEAWAVLDNMASRRTLRSAGFVEPPNTEHGEQVVKFELQNPNA